MKKPLILALGAASLLVTAPLIASAEVSDKEFEKLMESYLKSENGAEKIATAIQTHFQNKQEQNQRAELDKAFENPVKIDIGAAPVKGPANAKVTIVEFSDFQCPFCKRGRDTIYEVAKLYPNDVKIAFMNLPLPMHPEAGPSAKAALAAHKQGKFWEFHDALFDNQGKLNDSFYVETAKKLGLDIDKFNADRNSEEIAKQVKEEAAIASKNGISGTPGFFVNGVAVKGAYPVAHFKMIIDRWLSGGTKSAASGSAGTKS